MPYSCMAASHTATTWLRSMRETVRQRMRYGLCASVIVKGSHLVPSPVLKEPLEIHAPELIRLATGKRRAIM